MTANPAVLLAELRELVKATVRRSPGLNVRERLRAAARVLRLPVGRVTDWYYGEVRRVEAHEADAIRQFALSARQSEIARMERQLDALRADLAEMALGNRVRRGAAAGRGGGDRGRESLGTARRQGRSPA